MQATKTSGLLRRRLVFLGPPGAGKGMQADRVQDAFGLAHISTGEMFRQAVRRGDELGLKVKRFMEEGRLVPDHMVMKLVEQTLAALDERPGFVLDGVPRTLAQAEQLASLLDGRGTPIQAVILLEASEETVLRRLSGRRECPVCGRIYNIYFDPPKRNSVCDVDGASLVQRADDEPAVVRQRLQVYQAETTPVVDYYRKAGLLFPVDANQGGEEVFGQVSRIIQGGGSGQREDEPHAGVGAGG